MTLQGIQTVGMFPATPPPPASVGMFNYNPSSNPALYGNWPLVMGPKRRYAPRSTGQQFNFDWRSNPSYDPSFSPPAKPPLFIMGRR